MKKYQTIVVGGGIAGLTAGCYLVKDNINTLIIEKEKYVGGLVGTFDHKGFKFDRGARSIESSGIVIPMINNLGLDVKFVRTPINMIFGKERVILDKFEDIEKYKQTLINFFPQEEKGINLIMRDIYEVMENMDVLYGIENPLFIDKPYTKEYLTKTLLPWGIKLLGKIGKIGKVMLPLNDHIKQYTNNQSLIDMITQHFFEATPANFALSYFTLYLDYQYPLGGTGALANEMEKYFLSKGGNLALESRVIEVDAENKIVRTNNESFSYEELVWAGDTNTLYKVLKPVSDKKLSKKLTDRKIQLAKSRGADSVASVYYGVDLPASFFLERVGGHTFYTPSMLGQSSVPLSLVKDEQGNFIKDKNKLFKWVSDYLEVTTYELSIPAVRDISLAPKNQAGLIASALFDYGLTKHILNLGLYDELKEVLMNTFTKVLNNGALKGFKDKILLKFPATPLTIESYTLNHEGSLTGWSFVNNPFPAVFKFGQVTKSVLTGIPNISQCGQWTFNPAGIPIAALTGKIASDRVVKIFKRKKK